MSINRNVNLIKAIQPQVERNPVSYNFDATVYAIGGGGGGESSITTLGREGGGGGGAGAVVSSSLSVVPNITWTIEVGGGGTSDTNGQDTLVIAYDDNYSGLTTYKAQGGRRGSNHNGGNSGTGSIETNAATASYSAFTGGAEVTGGGRNSAGGGAGAFQNGGSGTTYDGNPGTGIGGIGGIGSGIFGSVAGGGGGGVTADSQQGGLGQFGGGDGGFIGTPIQYDGYDATKYGSGGGGASGYRADEGGVGGDGYRGAVFITFAGKIGTGLGEYDIEVTNASVQYTGGSTTITFNSGSGTFRYTAPYPYVPGN